MLPIRNQRVVNASRDKVFNYLADFARLSEWLWTGKSVTTGAAGGSTILTVRFGRWDERTFEVTDFVRNERIAWERDTERHFIEVQAADGGTRITYGYEFVRVWNPILLPFLLVIHLLSSNLSPLGRWYNARVMNRLQEQLESGL